MKIFPINKHALLKIFIDGSVWSVITFIAFYIRLEDMYATYANDILIISAFIIPVKFLLVVGNGHYKTSWRYSTYKDLFAPILSIFVISIIYYIAVFVLRGRVMIPKTVPLIDAGLSFIAFLSIRFGSYILLRKHKTINHYIRNSNNKKNVLVAGAGESGTMIVKEMLHHHEMGLSPIGFLDDDPKKQHQHIVGVPVLGKIEDMSAIIRTHSVDEIIIAMPSESGNTIRRILDTANLVHIPCRIIPGFYDIVSGSVSINQIRNVQVEDLLRRNPVNLNMEKIESYLKGKRVMVTGAGGSIGSEIVRQVAHFFPAHLILIGRGENTIHEFFQEFQRIYSYIPVDVKIADVRDKRTLEQIFQETKPDVVFHAAAHKHVYLMEDNPSQAVYNNIGGTQNLVDLSLHYNVKSFVNISTDKAINPTSVMGATKRIAELLVEQASRKAKPGQIFVSVRFGNVLGSRGSVVPIFKDQISRGGPVTITHPEMVRYFMTIPEATQLVLQAGALGINGAVFVLDMGEPVKIVDMARDLIRLSGLEPDVDIPIKFTGIRPGEKLYEELLTTEEGTEMTQHEKIFIARKNGSVKDLDKKIERLYAVTNTGEPQAIREMLKNIVPEYKNGNGSDVKK